jgi:hypothetical protein
VFVNHRHDKKVLAQIMKTTFFKILIFDSEHHQNAMKFHLYEEKTVKTQRKKSGGKLELFFGPIIFRGLCFYVS